MKKINFSKHVTEDRMDRYLFIATHMGFGEIIYEVWDDDKYNYKCITSTGVVLVLSPDKETVITLFLGDYDKIYALMKGEVPPELKKTLKQYAKKGWILLYPPLTNSQKYGNIIIQKGSVSNDQGRKGGMDSKAE